MQGGQKTQIIIFVVLAAWCLSFAYFYLCGGLIFLTPTPMRLFDFNDFISKTPLVFALLQCIYSFLLAFLLLSFSKKTQSKKIMLFCLIYLLFSFIFNYMWFVWTEFSPFQTVNEYKKIAKIAIVCLSLLVVLSYGLLMRECFKKSAEKLFILSALLQLCLIFPTFYFEIAGVLHTFSGPMFLCQSFALLTLLIALKRGEKSILRTKNE